MQILLKSFGEMMDPSGTGAYARQPTLEGLINIIVGMTYTARVEVR